VGALVAIWTFAVIWLGEMTWTAETEMPVPGANWTAAPVAMLKPFPLIVKVKELPCADCCGAKLMIVIWALHGNANSVRNKQERRIRFAIGVS
jgi:hypothetical protein